MGLFDVHAHLTHPKLAPREGEILENARRANITSIISNGLNPADNERVRALAARSSLVRPAFGLYPVDAVLLEMDALGVKYERDDAPTSSADAVAWVRAHAQEAFAIGEIGLDGYWVPEELWPKQDAVFRELVQVALDAHKPIIVHTRKRERQTFDILKEMGIGRVNWHCFGSKVKLAQQIAEHGHFLSIPANARRSETFTRMLQALPRERLLLETDCPYLGPDRTRDNEPMNVAETLRYAAELWGTSEDAVLEQLSRNYTELFGTAP